MIARVLLLTICCYGVNTATIPKDAAASSDQCVDKIDCEQFSSFCGFSTVLKTLCPKTCGTCQGFEDPCKLQNGGCNHYCSGSLQAECSCRDGFRLGGDSKTCMDIDECEQNPCSVGLECVNTVGSYSCQRLNCAKLAGLDFLNYYKSDSCCIAEPNDSTLSRAYDSKTEIEESLTTPVVQWPWMAQILNYNAHQCGGVLVSNKWVVTSSLCVESDNYEPLKIVLGNVLSAHHQTNFSSSAVERKVRQVVFHPEPELNEIVLVELDEAVEFSDLIQPVTFPCGNTPRVGSTCFMTGFGTTDNLPSSQPSRKLKEIALPIVSPKYCASVYSSVGQNFNETTNICAGRLEGGEDACYGDSGSPIVCQSDTSCDWYVAGIGVTGFGCGAPGFPGIYTNFVEHESYIRNTLGKNFQPNCPQ